jgi:unsaturated rhamnogalacturonyl hydrolase
MLKRLAAFVSMCVLAGCSTGSNPATNRADSAAATDDAPGSTTGGSSGTGGRDTATATGGTSFLGGSTTSSGGASAPASGGTVTGTGGAGAGGGAARGGSAIATGGAQGGGSGGTGNMSATGGAGRGGNSSGGSGAGGASGTGGKTGTGGSGGSTGAADAGAAGQGGGDGGTTLAADSLAVRFANMILSKWPDPANITTSAGFEYNHGIVLRGIEQVYRHTGDSRYLAYIQKYIDENVNASGVINLGTTFSAFDNMQPSVLLPFLFQETGLAKYKTAADTVRAFYNNIPTNADGGFWHKQVYPNQMWLDGIYMGEPFLARYAAVFGSCGTYCGDTVVKQSTLIALHTLDTPTGLYYHAWWDSNPASTKPAWADANGRSPCIWGRAMGWYAMALVDTLGDLPANQTGRSDLLSILTGVAAGLKATQDAKTGLWFQVMDQGSKTDNWTETSASGMIVYALKVAVNRGYIDASYSSVADSGWTGLQTKVTTDAAGVPTITGAVQGMSVQNNYAGYVGQQTVSNSSHGLCAILLAASEMEAR